MRLFAKHLLKPSSLPVVTASSVTSALIAVVIGVVAGGLIGLLAGFLGGWVDIVLARLVDVLLAIPNFLLAVIVVTAIGFDTTNAAIATGVSAVAVFARVMRSEVIKTRQATFVEASFLLGGSRWHILLRHVLPNASRSVLPLAVLQFGLSILVIASLAFLGYGDPPPASDWGLLISIGKDYLKWPWLVYAPAFVTIVSIAASSRMASSWVASRRAITRLVVRRLIKTCGRPKKLASARGVRRRQ